MWIVSTTYKESDDSEQICKLCGKQGCSISLAGKQFTSSSSLDFPRPAQSRFSLGAPGTGPSTTLPMML